MNRAVFEALDRPFVVLFQQGGADQADDGLLVGEDSDQIGSAFDLTVEAIERVGGVGFDSVLLGEGHVGEHIGFGLVHQGGQFRHFGAELIGDLAPLGLGGFGAVLGKGVADEGDDDPAALLVGVGQDIAHEMGVMPTSRLCRPAPENRRRRRLSPQWDRHNPKDRTDSAGSPFLQIKGGLHVTRSVSNSSIGSTFSVRGRLRRRTRTTGLYGTFRRLLDAADGSLEPLAHRRGPGPQLSPHFKRRKELGRPLVFAGSSRRTFRREVVGVSRACWPNFATCPYNYMLNQIVSHRSRGRMALLFPCPEGTGRGV